MAGITAKEPVEMVNVLTGTDSNPSLSCGNTYPAIARPWGMNLWTPVTGKMGDGWTYTYNANKLRGIKQTHQPSPWINDYGQWTLMPLTGKKTVDEEERASWFSHKAETATPYYYSAYLADYDITLEMTPSDRGAIFRIHYPTSEEAYLVIDALDNGSSITIDPENGIITGFSTKNSGGVPDNFRNYFAMEFDHPITYYATADSGNLTEERKSFEGNHAAALIGFNTAKGEPVNVRVASSFISPEQARLNLKEVEGKSLEEVKEEGKEIWNAMLGRIKVEDDDSDHIKTFYSNLYRTLLFPHKFYEYNAEGAPVHYSPHDGKVYDGYLYTGTGFWDTFRALFPLVNLIYPDEGRKMQAGWANVYRESGFLPEWSSPGHRGCMVGNNSASVVADAYLKGLTDPDDAEILWEAVTKGAHAVHPDISSTGRLGHEYYDSLGYVPCNVGINESAARTLEYAYDDYCIYQMGKKMNRPEKEIRLYARNAKNYRHLFNSSHKLMRGKRDDGSWQTPFNPFKWGDAFTEGNSWHYTWSVFHDPRGLSDLMGGDREFAAMLDSVFSLPPIFDESYYGFVIHEIREMQIMGMGNYAHGNQPVQHAIYLYGYAGEPWKSQHWVREVMERLYSATPDGYCGDEDNGQTSAWYVFSAMGFYPVNPVGGEYVIGTPYFKKMVIELPDGKSLTIDAPENGPANRYIGSMTLNGDTLTRNYLRYDELMKGGNITFGMQPQPDYRRGTLPADRPTSFE